MARVRRPRVRGRLPAPALAAALLLLAGCGSGGKAGSSPALAGIGAGLKGPTGLTASVYAHGPPTTAVLAFDPQGRLWLSAAGLEAHAHDGVYLIPRPDAPAQRVLAGLDDPLGLAWYQGSLYVASVGRVDAYGAFNGTRFTRHRTILTGPPRSCAAKSRSVRASKSPSSSPTVSDALGAKG